MVQMYRVKTEFTGLAGSPYLSQMYFQSALGSAQGAVDDVGAFWGAIDAFCNSDLIWNTLADVELVESTTGQLVGVTQTTPANGSGGVATEVLPFATQGLIRWRTGVYVGGRELRGKTFIPGLTEASAAQGQMASATQNALDGAASALLSGSNSALCIFSRKHLTEALVATGSAWNQFAVLRSRRD